MMGRLDRSGSAGLTIVELLVAGAILVIVLGLGATFFAQQTQLQRAVQTRNEVQDRVRVAMQLVTQDLALVGNSVLIRADGSIDSLAGLTGGGCDRESFDDAFPDVENCLALVNSGTQEAPYESSLSLRYLSSLFPTAEACRDVRYRLTTGDEAVADEADAPDAGVLQRSDVECGAGSEGEPDWLDLAPGIEAFSVMVVCSDATRHTEFPSTSCSPAGTPPAFGRGAIVSIVAQSLNTVPGNDNDRSVATTDANATAPHGVVPCPVNRVCFAATEELTMPNMKDR